MHSEFLDAKFLPGNIFIKNIIILKKKNEYHYAGHSF